MKKLFLGVSAVAAGLMAVPASATVIFTSTFESVAGGPTANGTFTNVQTADGWNATDANHPIELQRRVAGSPSTGVGQFDGGNVFVELDSTRNSSMFRTLDAGTYSLSFLYSPRPNVASTSNGIEVLLNGVLLNPPGLVTGAGGANTNWALYSTGTFTAGAGSTLTFRAAGTSDSLGGYLDNITLSAVPEPATWAMMLIGFGMAGYGMRSRRKDAVRITYA